MNITRLETVSKNKLELIKEIDKSSIVHPWNESMWSNVLTDETYDLWEVVSDDSLVGFALMHVPPVETVELFKIAIAAASRKSGLATKLLEQIIFYYLRLGKKKILLEVSSINDLAIKFYTQLGFKQYSIRKAYYPDKSDGVLMEFSLIK